MGGFWLPNHEHSCVLATGDHPSAADGPSLKLPTARTALAIAALVWASSRHWTVRGRRSRFDNFDPAIVLASLRRRGLVDGQCRPFP
jgi:hypothetical protein